MKKKTAYITVCRSKKKFKNQTEAKSRALEINKDSLSVLYAYKCNACDGWHLTKKTDEERKDIRKKVNEAQKKHNVQYENQIKKEADYWVQKNNWE